MDPSSQPTPQRRSIDPTPCPSRTRLGLGGQLALSAFVVIFAGHIVYQLMVHAGLFPPVLGGYFTASALAMLPLVVLSVSCSTYLRVGMGVPLYGGFMLLFGLGIALGIHDGVAPDITIPHAAFFLKFTCFYLLAATTPWEQRRFQQVCRLLLALLACLVLGNALYYGVTFATDVDLDSEMQMDYQGMAFAYLVVALGALHGARRMIRLRIYLLSAPVLFLIGARAEFVAFFVVVVLMEYLLARSKTVFLLKMLCALALAAALACLAEGVAPDSRILNLLDVDSDESMVERRDLHAEALQTIQEHPLMGNYGSYAAGKYAHNLLSAWVDLGLAGFVLLNLMFFSALLDVYIKRRRPRWNGSLAFSAAILVTTYFLLIFAKAYTYQLIPIALGAYLHMQSRDFRSRAASLT